MTLLCVIRRRPDSRLKCDLRYDPDTTAAAAADDDDDDDATSQWNRWLRGVRIKTLPMIKMS